MDRTHERSKVNVKPYCHLSLVCNLVDQFFTVSRKIPTECSFKYLSLLAYINKSWGIFWRYFSKVLTKIKQVDLIVFVKMQKYENLDGINYTRCGY